MSAIWNLRVVVCGRRDILHRGPLPPELDQFVTINSSTMCGAVHLAPMI
jgi:hypothetical protein